MTPMLTIPHFTFLSYSNWQVNMEAMENLSTSFQKLTENFVQVAMGKEL